MIEKIAAYVILAIIGAWSLGSCWLAYEKSKRRRQERRRREAIQVEIIRMPKKPEVGPCEKASCNRG